MLARLNIATALSTLMVSVPLIGCSTTAYLLTGESGASARAAASEVEPMLRNAEQKGCRAIGVGTGTGLGFTVDERDEKDSVRDQAMHTVQILVQCPKGVTL